MSVTFRPKDRVVVRSVPPAVSLVIRRGMLNAKGTIKSVGNGVAVVKMDMPCDSFGAQTFMISTHSLELCK